MLEIRSDNHCFVKDLTFSDMSPFTLGSMSLGIASKILAEDYCPGRSVHW